jgi:surface-adhesin protein E
MKKILLSLVLVVVSSSAVAEWILIGGDDKFRLYSNPATIIKSDSMVKMLRLTDFKAAQRIDSKYYLSTKRQDEYDCVKEQYRIIYVNAYTENMGEGNVVMRVVNKPDDWKLIPPGSQGEAVWKFACGE